MKISNGVEKKNKKIIYPSFKQYLTQEMKNKAFRRAYKEESHRLKIAYKIFQLRKKHRLSQKELARKLDTTQSVVARIETRQQNLTTDTLQKIASIFDRDLRSQNRICKIISLIISEGELFASDYNSPIAGFFYFP